MDPEESISNNNNNNTASLVDDNNNNNVDEAISLLSISSSCTTTTTTTSPPPPLIATVIGKVTDNTNNGNEGGSSSIHECKNSNNNSNNSNNNNQNDMIERLIQEHSFPKGLAYHLVQQVVGLPTITQCYYLMDNSGSMLMNDAIRLIPKDIMEVGGCTTAAATAATSTTPKNIITGTLSSIKSSFTKQRRTSSSNKMYHEISCNRWNELQHTVIAHLEIMDILLLGNSNTTTTTAAVEQQVPLFTTTFRFLKRTSTLLPQEFTIGSSSSSSSSSSNTTTPSVSIEEAKRIILETQPDGVTLLSKAIEELVQQVLLPQKDIYEHSGQKIILIICTDGLPTDAYGNVTEETKQEFQNQLLQLQLLPVFIVFRLCTKERNIIRYYSTMDKALEIPMDCVSQYISEAKEVQQYNDWLNYIYPIHICREMGIITTIPKYRIFDLMDEHTLNKDHVVQLCHLLFHTGTSNMTTRTSIECSTNDKEEEEEEGVFDTTIISDDIIPNIHTDFITFTYYIQNQLQNQNQMLYYNPCTKYMDEMIHMSLFTKIYSKAIIPNQPTSTAMKNTITDMGYNVMNKMMIYRK